MLPFRSLLNALHNDHAADVIQYQYDLNDDDEVSASQRTMRRDAQTFYEELRNRFTDARFNVFVSNATHRITIVVDMVLDASRIDHCFDDMGLAGAYPIFFSNSTLRKKAGTHALTNGDYILKAKVACACIGP